MAQIYVCIFIFYIKCQKINNTFQLKQNKIIKKKKRKEVHKLQLPAQNSLSSTITHIASQIKLHHTTQYMQNHSISANLKKYKTPKHDYNFRSKIDLHTVPALPVHALQPQHPRSLILPINNYLFYSKNFNSHIYQRTMIHPSPRVTQNIYELQSFN